LQTHPLAQPQKTEEQLQKKFNCEEPRHRGPALLSYHYRQPPRPHFPISQQLSRPLRFIGYQLPHLHLFEHFSALHNYIFYHFGAFLRMLRVILQIVP